MASGLGLLVFFALGLICLSSFGVQGTEEPCNDIRYDYVQAPAGGFTWFEALADAMSRGGFLARVEDHQKQLYLLNYGLPGSQVTTPLWLAGYNPGAGTPEWTYDNLPFSSAFCSEYNFFCFWKGQTTAEDSSPSPTTESCRYTREFGIWESMGCSTKLTGYIIEYPYDGGYYGNCPSEAEPDVLARAISTSCESMWYTQIKTTVPITWTAARFYAQWSFLLNGEPVQDTDLMEPKANYLGGLGQHSALISYFEPRASWILLKYGGGSWKTGKFLSVSVNCSGYCLWEGRPSTPNAPNGCGYMHQANADWWYADCSSRLSTFIVQAPYVPEGEDVGCSSRGLATDDHSTFAMGPIGPSGDPFLGPNNTTERVYSARQFAWSISKATALQFMDLESDYGFTNATLAPWASKTDYLYVNALMGIVSASFFNTNPDLWIAGERRELSATNWEYVWNFTWVDTYPATTVMSFFRLQGGCVGSLCMFASITSSPGGCLVQGSQGWTPRPCSGFTGAKGYVMMSAGDLPWVSRPEYNLNFATNYIPNPFTERCCAGGPHCFGRGSTPWPYDWSMASQFAVANDWVLATVFNLNEAVFISQQFPSEPAWIGAKANKWQEGGLISSDFNCSTGNQAYCVPKTFSSPVCAYQDAQGTWRSSDCTNLFTSQKAVNAFTYQTEPSGVDHTACDSVYQSDCDGNSGCCGGTCYCLLQTGNVVYETAKDLAKSLNFVAGAKGRLATLMTDELYFYVSTNTALLDFTQGTDRAWIDGTDVASEGVWRLENNTIFYQNGVCNAGVCNWITGAPANDNSKNCRAMNFNGAWVDVPCGAGSVNHVLVEWSVAGGTCNAMTTFLANSSTALPKRCCGGKCYAQREINGKGRVTHLFSAYLAAKEGAALVTPRTAFEYYQFSQLASPLFIGWGGGGSISGGLSWSSSSGDAFYFASSGCVPGAVCVFEESQPSSTAGPKCLAWNQGEVWTDYQDGFASCDQGFSEYVLQWNDPTNSSTDCVALPVLNPSYSFCCNDVDAFPPGICQCPTACYDYYHSLNGAIFPWNIAKLLAANDSDHFLADLRYITNMTGFLDHFAAVDEIGEPWVGGTRRPIQYGVSGIPTTDFFWATYPDAPARVDSNLVMCPECGPELVMTAVFPGEGGQYRLRAARPGLEGPFVGSAMAPAYLVQNDACVSPSPSTSPSITASTSRSASPSTSISSTAIPPVLPSSSSSTPEKTKTPTPTPPPPPPPPTPTPKKKPDGKIVCTTAKSCEDKQEVPPCKDLESSKCQSEVKKCADKPNSKECQPQNPEVIVKVPDTNKKQTYTFSNAGGGVLGDVTIDPKKFPKGATVKIKYVPPGESDDLDKDTDEGCSAEANLLSLGTFEVEAYDKDGKPIKEFDDTGVTVGFNIPGDKTGEDVCVGSTDKSKDSWDCPKDKARSKKKGDVTRVEQDFDHLTSFAVFIGTNTGCGPWWIIAITMIFAVPIGMAVIMFLLSRTVWGQKFIYGYKGKSLQDALKSINRHSSAYPSTSAIQTPGN